MDPDAPTPQHPTSAQIRHFLGGNFRLQHSRFESKFGDGAVLVNNTPALSNYLQPSPPNTSDPHRSVFHNDADRRNLYPFLPQVRLAALPPTPGFSHHYIAEYYKLQYLGICATVWTWETPCRQFHDGQYKSGCSGCSW